MNTRASDASGTSVGRSMLMLQKTARRLSSPASAALRVDLVDERLADLEPEEVGLGMVRRALEQEARVGAAELDLDVAIGRQLPSTARSAAPRYGERSGLT